MLSWQCTKPSKVTCVDANSSVSSRVLEVPSYQLPVMSADLIVGDNEFQRIDAVNESDLSAKDSRWTIYG